MNQVAWVSNVMNDPRQMRAITTDLNESDSKKAISIERRNDAGESLKEADFPKVILPGKNKKGPFKRMPDLFKAGCYWVVSSRVADVLCQFNLGGGGLYPVKVFQKDRTTRVDGDFYCINFGNVKRAFILDASSRGIRPGPDERIGEGRYAPMYYKLPFVPVDDEVAVSTIALQGPDIWVDPMLFSTFFVSDRLRSALKKARLDGAFQLFRCRVADGN